jgi:hypothetical protein
MAAFIGYCAHSAGQAQNKTPMEYHVVYLVHLQSYRAWPWSSERISKHSPRDVLSLDTMYIEVNHIFKHSSPGLKREPAFRLSILADVIEVRFPKGDTLVVNFKTQLGNSMRLPKSNRIWDTTIQITNAANKDFYFVGYRRIGFGNRNDPKLVWNLFNSSNTRKQLSHRLKNNLIRNTVRKITTR